MSVAAKKISFDAKSLCKRQIHPIISVYGGNMCELRVNGKYERGPTELFA